MKKSSRLINWLLIIVMAISSSPAFADTLSDKQQELKNLQKKIEEQETALSKIRNQKLTLSNQIKLLDNQIDTAQLALEELDIQITTIGLEKSALNHELVDLEEQALGKRLDLKKAIRTSYMYSQDGIVEILFTSNSFNDFTSKVTYLDSVERKISSNLISLGKIKEELSTKKELLEDKNERLSEVRQKKIIEEQSWKIQVNAKNNIVKDLKLSESEYQKRLEDARTEEQTINNDIAILLRQVAPKILIGEKKLAWPIPYRRITAGFRDPDYARTFGLPHNGMDIAAPQGTPIKCPANGVVSKIKNGGARGLSYMVISHDSGLATVYMHLSAFAVGTGARVIQGQTIGYTGGTPGTPGAGWLTTGPHLHLEVWDNDQARNPLAYLI